MGREKESGGSLKKAFSILLMDSLDVCVSFKKYCRKEKWGTKRRTVMSKTTKMSEAKHKYEPPSRGNVVSVA